MTSKTQVSIQGQVGIRSILRDGVHSYILNDTKAIKVMMTNAVLPAISAPDKTTQTSQLQLSTGSFSQVIQPLFSYWRSFDLTQGQELVEGDTKVVLVDVRCDTEESNKLVDALAKFTYCGKSISLFGYYTNQTVMVQGKYHEEFLNLFLNPLLAKMIAQKRRLIEDFNKLVIESLQPKIKKPNHDDSVWDIATPDRTTCNVKLRRKQIKCDVCGKSCSGVSELKIHITNNHSDRTKAKPRSSTRMSRQVITNVPRATSNTIRAISQDVVDLDSSEEDEPLEKTFPHQSYPLTSLEPNSRTSEYDEKDKDPIPEVDISSCPSPEMEANKTSMEPEVEPASETTESDTKDKDPTSEVDISSGPSPEVEADKTSMEPEVEPASNTTESDEKGKNPISEVMKSSSPSPEVETVSDEKDKVPTSDGDNMHTKPKTASNVAHVQDTSMAPVQKNYQDPQNETGPPFKEAGLRSEAPPEESNKRPEVVEPLNEMNDDDEIFNFMCAVCGQGLNSTQKAMTKHVENHGHALSVVSIMKEMYNLKRMWLKQFESKQQEVDVLKREIESIKSDISHKTVFKSSAPPSRPAPAPASPPSNAGPSSAPQQAGAGPPSQEPTYAQKASSRTSSPLSPGQQQQPLTFRPTHRPQGGGRVSHLLLADSITRALVYPKLEAPSGSLIKQVNTYSAEFDERAHKPHRNTNQVIREELKKKSYNTVILGAPSVDITNQDVSEGILDENVAETVSSSLAMVEAAEYAIKSGRVKKVVLLQHAPRYDTPRNDPHGVRPQLSQLANTHLQKARDASDLAEHILVGEHSGLECEGSTRTSRFTSDQTHIRNWGVKLGKYDGVHMYSQEGAEALTKSLLAILHTAGMLRKPQQWGLGLPSPSAAPPGAQGQWSGPPPARGFRGNPRPQVRGRREFEGVPVSNRFQNFH